MQKLPKPVRRDYGSRKAVTQATMYYRRKKMRAARAGDLTSLLSSLYGEGQEGAFFIPRPVVLGQQVLFQDAAGAVPVTADGDPVGLMLDLSPNSNHATQETSGKRPIYRTDGQYARIQLDKVDDNLSVNLAEPVNGTMLLATRDGIVHADVDIPAGEWSITANPSYYPGDTLVGLILRDGAMTEQELAAAKDYLISIGAGADQFAGVTDMYSWLRGRTDLTALHAETWNTNSVNDISGFIYESSNVSYLNINSWNTYALGNKANGFANGATALHTVVVSGGTGSPFSDSACTNYTGAFNNTNLSQQSIDDILVAIEAAGTSDGTFGQSGGSAPSSVGEAAIDALRARGWTVTVTGGY